MLRLAWNVSENFVSDKVKVFKFNFEKICQILSLTLHNVLVKAGIIKLVTDLLLEGQTSNSTRRKK